MISDAHEGLKAAMTRVLGATWRRCRVHWTRNALAYVPKGQHTMVAAALRLGRDSALVACANGDAVRRSHHNRNQIRLLNTVDCGSGW